MNERIKWTLAGLFMFVMSILNLYAGIFNTNNLAIKLFNMFCGGLTIPGIVLCWFGYMLDSKKLVKG